MTDFLKYSNYKSQSYCFENDEYFNFHGINNALIGKPNGSTFTPKKILVIQMI